MCKHFLGGITLLALVNVVVADVPGQINHQGVVKVNGTPFNGTGQFRFAIFDPDTGDNYWTNDNTFVPGPGTPTQPVPIQVNNGIYTVMLGDTSLTNMTNAIPNAVFKDDNPALRVWFNDGVNGIQQFDPHPLVSVPYAKRAGNSILAHQHGVYLPDQPIPPVASPADLNNENNWWPVPGSTKVVKLNKGQTMINWAAASYYATTGQGAIFIRPYVRPAVGSDINGDYMFGYMISLATAGSTEEDEAIAGTVLVSIPEAGDYTIGIEILAEPYVPNTVPRISRSVQWTALSLTE